MSWKLTPHISHIAVLLNKIHHICKNMQLRVRWNTRWRNEAAVIFIVIGCCLQQPILADNKPMKVEADMNTNGLNQTGSKTQLEVEELKTEFERVKRELRDFETMHEHFITLWNSMVFKVWDNDEKTISNEDVSLPHNSGTGNGSELPRLLELGSLPLPEEIISLLACRQGPKGEKGENGYSGVVGLKGEPGKTGVPGFPGLSGLRGIKGGLGFPGMDGPKGSPGEPARTGSKGEDGYPGEPGRVGRPGLDGLTGEKGDNGVRGFPGSKGSAGPGGPTGKSGEYIIGVKGDPGLPGITGEKGDQGMSGFNGQKGSPGFTGPPGPHGEKGESGKSGNRRMFSRWFQ